MKNNEWNALIEKYLAGDCTSSEKQLVEQFYEQLADEKNVLYKGDRKKIDFAVSQSFEQVQQKIRTEEGKHKVKKTPNIVTRKLFTSRAYYIAASLIFGLIAVALYLNINEPIRSAQVKNIKSQPIQPGSNKATLTLADGSTVVLDNAKTGIVATQGGSAINKTADGQLIYNPGEGNNMNLAAQAYNMITIPAGGQYKVTLPDGSKVWLNCASSLKYPPAFSGNERVVWLQGEAYFEIAENKSMPFKVQTEKQTVEVLGTHFNINAYTDEASVKTTLLEGSVKISSNIAETTIKPGQQAVLDKKSDHINVSGYDVEEAVAWKNGYFMFASEDLHSIMRKISRWYNVEVSYQNPVNERFAGVVSRFEDVSEVLKILEITGTVHFKIEGRRIIVMQ